MTSRLCEVCGKLTARYVCQECSRKVCEACLDDETWLCSECYRRIEQKAPLERRRMNLTLNAPLMKVFIIGFFLIFIGMIILMVAAIVSGMPDSSFGFFLLIGFIPIIFGAGQYSPWIAFLTAIATILIIVLFIILWKRKVSKKL